ncbi:vascular endothelial growth factor A isoform X2 [Protopterus annectens]|uniref:vascular endothelial growth factor A isoform X2 n=1 Tax=Protopterus annectens TaxID=7888 RepID=UPI001CFACBB5|nr:vascular endothelial growth factor A isoform X2 [Protopterus annectens]
MNICVVAFELVLTGLFIFCANVSMTAHIPEDTEKKQEVIGFVEVYARSYCRSIEMMVDIFQEYPEEVEYIFRPSCVPLMRCAGCCSDESLECIPLVTYNVTMEIMRLKPHHGGHKVLMSFSQHKNCTCRPKEVATVKPENPCEPCSERRKRFFVQDPLTCKCSCKHSHSHCKLKQLELNERTCRCEKPR